MTLCLYACFILKVCCLCYCVSGHFLSLFPVDHAPILPGVTFFFFHGYFLPFLWFCFYFQFCFVLFFDGAAVWPSAPSWLVLLARRMFVVFLRWSFLFLLPVLAFARVVVGWFIARDLWDFSALRNRLSGSDHRCPEAQRQQQLFQKGPAPPSVSTFGSITFHPGVSKESLDSKCHLHWKTHHIFGGKPTEISVLSWSDSKR